MKSTRGRQFIILYLVSLTFLLSLYQNCQKSFETKDASISGVVPVSTEDLNQYIGSQPGAATPTPTPTTTPTPGSTPAPDPFAVQSSESTEQGGILYSNQVVFPSIRKDSGGKKRGVFFSSSGSAVIALNIKGQIVWQKSMHNTGVRAGLDWNQDGVSDVFVAERHLSATNTYCYDSDGQQTSLVTSVLYSSLHLLDGATGNLLFTFGSPMPDFCWAPPGASSVLTVPQWTPQSVIDHDGYKMFAISPTYASQSWIIRRNASGGAIAYALSYPSTTNFAEVYSAARVAGGGQKFWANSHIFNGLLLSSGLGFFTSGRFLEYGYQDYSSSQLRYDLPFLPDGTTAAAGRNYGLVTKDPNSNFLSLIAGCSVQSVLNDTVNGNNNSDPSCGIHRHVTIVDLAAPAIKESRYFSYVHTGGTGAMNFEKRITYPAHVLLKTSGQASRLVYNEYTGGHWYLHISEPGSAQSRYALKDQFVWDVVDINQDGQDELILTEMRNATQPDVPGYYAAPWNTTVANWVGDSLIARKSYAGYLPALGQLDKQDSIGTSEYALTAVARDLSQPSAIFLRNSSGVVKSFDY